MIESAESGGTHRRTGAEPIKVPRLWGLTPAVSALAVAQLRTALRSVRGRLIVTLPGPMLAVLALVSRRVPKEFPGGSLFGSQGDVLLGAGIVFSLYALQAFTLNQFATDRAGLSRQFLAPITDLDLVKGKAVGCGLILAVAVLLCLICSLIVAPGGSPLDWLSVLLGGAATYMLLTPVAVLLSATFPVASDLSKTGSGGNPHTAAFLIGTLLVLLLSVPPGLILSIASHLLHRPGLALLLMVLGPCWLRRSPCLFFVWRPGGWGRGGRILLWWHRGGSRFEGGHRDSRARQTQARPRHNWASASQSRAITPQKPVSPATKQTSAPVKPRVLIRLIPSTHFGQTRVRLAQMTAPPCQTSTSWMPRAFIGPNERSSEAKRALVRPERAHMPQQFSRIWITGHRPAHYGSR